MDAEVVLKRFEQPDGTRPVALGKFAIARLGGLTIGQATCQRGWKWPEPVSNLQERTEMEPNHKQARHRPGPTSRTSW